MISSLAIGDSVTKIILEQWAAYEWLMKSFNQMGTQKLLDMKISS
jgi:hypothetical protein